MSNSGIRLIRMREVAHRVGRGETTLRNMVKRGEFPAPLRLGNGPTSPRMWIEAEIDGWLAARLEAAQRRAAA